MQPSSANSSQEFGLNRLTLRRDPPDADAGDRIGVKRPKTAETPSPSRSPRNSVVRSARQPARGRRDANQRSARVIPEPRSTASQRPAPAKLELPLNPATAQPHSAAISQVGDRAVIEMPIDARYPNMYLQPDSRPISQEQLAAEVKSIYSGLTMVEAKCIHVDKAQAAAIRSAERGESERADDHWTALFALHRTLLHEHHDFFLASQHPSASPALQRLAAKYSMPARMWKHGIHSFLELLRYRLPDSLDYMISFIYFAYQMMSLLYETVRAFEDTWIECLGDLGRYRMAIEEEDAGVRETWAGVARFWYSKAASRSPAVGRLSHHLAILARPHALRQLYLFCRSLTCIQPFLSARESIVTLFDPATGSTNLEASNSSTSRIDSLFIRLHSILFTKDKLEEFDGVLQTFLGLLDSHITTAGEKWREEGSHIAVSAIAALFDYGSPDSILRKLMEHGNFRIRQQAKALENADGANASPSASPGSEPSLEGLKAPDSLSRTQFLCAVDMFSKITKLVFCRTGDNKTTVDRNVLPFANLALTFYHSLADIHSLNLPFDGLYVTPLLHGIPREEISVFGNNLFKAEDLDSKYEIASFIRPEKGDVGPIVEDHMVRGQSWAQWFFPADWFETEDDVDEEETLIERASTMPKRVTRVAWLLRRQAEVSANMMLLQTRD